MNGMEKISSAILNKVNADAVTIVKEAEERAKQRVEKAKEQRQVKYEEDKARMLAAAQMEASRIMAQGTIRARQEMLAVKTAVIDGIIDETRKSLAGIGGNEKVLSALLKDSIATLNVEKIRVYVPVRDVTAMQKLVKDDKNLQSKVIEIQPRDMLGGVIVEDTAGKNRIDNSFDSRLEMLLPKMLPRIEKELF